jgi:hypothetical protein
MTVKVPLRTYLSTHCEVGALHGLAVVVANDIAILYVDAID